VLLTFHPLAVALIFNLITNLVQTWYVLNDSELLTVYRMAWLAFCNHETALAGMSVGVQGRFFTWIGDGVT
jgi:hypothetical protein